MKVIIEIPKDVYEECQGHIYFPDTGEELFNAVKNGTPLDDVKAEIQRTITASWYNGENYKKNYRGGLNDAIVIIDKHMRGEHDKRRID